MFCISMISSYIQRTLEVVFGITAVQNAEEHETSFNVLCGFMHVRDQVRAEN